MFRSKQRKYGLQKAEQISGWKCLSFRISSSCDITKCLIPQLPHLVNEKEIKTMKERIHPLIDHHKHCSHAC